MTRAQGGVPTVNRVSVTEVIEILHVRRLLESEAARQAAGVHSLVEPWLALRREIEGFLDGARPGAAAHMELDHRLHMTIARVAGSRLLEELIEGLKLKTRVFDKGSIPERFESGCHEHLAIIDAILARDPEAAEQEMRRHLHHARKAILSHINRLS